MKKRLLSTIFCATMVVSLSACGTNKTNNTINNNGTSQEDSVQEDDTKETVTIPSFDGTATAIELEVPYNPQRIAILDMASLDILEALGVEDRVVGSSSTSLEYLADIAGKEGMANLGTIKEADFEAVMQCEPDVIFIGGRLAGSYDTLSEIAPVVYLQMDMDLGIVESTRKNAEIIASMFGKEDAVADLMAGFADRIDALKEEAKEKTAVVGMATSGSFNLLSDDGRCSIIGKELGFNNIGAASAVQAEQQGGGSQGGSLGQGSSQGGSTATHGNEASFELVVSLAPDYMFVLDRDAAIGTEGAQLAKQIVENELIMGTEAYKNGNIIYLEHPAVWYTAEGGLTALDIMLADLEGMLFIR